LGTVWCRRGGRQERVPQGYLPGGEEEDMRGEVREIEVGAGRRWTGVVLGRVVGDGVAWGGVPAGAVLDRSGWYLFWYGVDVSQ